MTKTELEEIASHSLIVREASGNDVEVKIVIYRPYQSGMWYCEYKVDGDLKFPIPPVKVNGMNSIHVLHRALDSLKSLLDLLKSNSNKIYDANDFKNLGPEVVQEFSSDGFWS